MKKILVIVVIMILVSINVFTETNDIADAYEYPITPGTKEWKKLKSHIEMIEVSQIPENLLETMTTEGLLETVLNCPIIGDIIAFVPYQNGYNSVFRNFNGLQELSNREGLSQIILDKYYELNNTRIPENESRGIKFILKIVGIEMIISQDYIIDNLNVEQKIFLLRETIKRYESTNDGLGYSTSFKKSSFNIIDKVLLSLNYKPYIELLSLDENQNLKLQVSQFGYSIQKITIMLIDQAKRRIVEFDKGEIDNEKIMPMKLIFSELPDDYPKELDELFEFFYNTVMFVSDFDYEPTDFYDWFYARKTGEYLDNIPISKKIHLKYLFWLAKNTIPLYFAEYLSINMKKPIDNITEEELISMSILPRKFWEGHLKHPSPNTPSPGGIITLITKSITSQYPEKLNFLIGSVNVFIKCKITEEEFVERIYKGEKNNTFPTHYIKVKVLDSIGEEFIDEEIIIVVTYRPDSKEIPDIIQKGKEYMIPLSSLFSESVYDDKFTFCGSVINDNLSFFAPITRIYPLNDGKYRLHYRYYEDDALGKDSVSYEEFKNVVEAEIDFLKSFSSIGE